MGGIDYANELAKVDLFSGLNRTGLTLLSNTCTKVQAPRDQVVVREGEPGHSLFVILAGKVAMSKMDEKGDRVHLVTRGKGSVFGEMALLDGRPRSATVTTVEECLFLVLNRNEFVRSIENSPELALKMIASLSQKLRDADERAIMKFTVRQKVAKELLRMGQESEVVDDKGRMRFRMMVTGEQLASSIKATRESVSRELSFFRKIRAIANKDREYAILDPAKLREAIDPHFSVV